jgi:hypothetical protein
MFWFAFQTVCDSLVNDAVQSSLLTRDKTPSWTRVGGEVEKTFQFMVSTEINQALQNSKSIKQN